MKKLTETDVKYRTANRDDQNRINELFVDMIRSIYQIPADEDVGGYEKDALDKFFSGDNNLIFA